MTPLKLITISFLLALTGCGGGSSGSHTASVNDSTLSGIQSGRTPGKLENSSPVVQTPVPSSEQKPGNTPETSAVDLAAAKWQITDLTPLLPESSVLNDINDNGDILGQVFLTQALPGSPLSQVVGSHIFVIRNGELVSSKDLHTTTRFNNSGQIAAARNDQAGYDIFHPEDEVIFSGDAIRTSQIPVENRPEGLLRVNDINNRGEMIGTAYSRTQNVQQAFVFNKGKFTFFKTPDDWPNMDGRAINDSGQFTGCGVSLGATRCQTAYFYNGTKFELFSAPPSKTYVHPIDVNNSGQIIGNAMNEGDNSAPTWISFLYQNGKIEQLQLPAHGSSVHRINDFGQILGTMYFDPDFTDYTVFVLDRGNLIDLSKIPEFANQGYKVLSALSINNRGQILVQAGPRYGYLRRFLLTPVPG